MMNETSNYNSNYFEILDQTYEEKFEMYMKFSKEEIIKMLIESNNHLERFIKENRNKIILY